MENENYVGYLKFYGKNIENGIIQADIAGQTLMNGTLSAYVHAKCTGICGCQ